MKEHPKRGTLQKRISPELSSRSVEMESVYRLWEDVERFPASETDAALKRLAQGLKKLLKADNVRWMAAVRVLRGAKARKDPLRGWRLRASYRLQPDPKAYHKMVAWFYRRSSRLDPDYQIGLASHAVVAGAGKFRMHRLRDGWIPFREFERSDHYRLHYTQLGITDRVWICLPLNADSESIFLIDRCRSKSRFSKKESLLAAMILRGARGFHRRLFLKHGLLIGEHSLSPVLQIILQKLLTSMTEKEIALSMGQSLTTTHKYIRIIYQRLGVKGRASLMSLWLGA